MKIVKVLILIFFLSSSIAFANNDISMKELEDVSFPQTGKRVFPYVECVLNVMNAKVNIEYIIELISIRDLNGNYIFNSTKSVTFAANMVVEIEYIKELIKIERNGILIYDNSYDLLLAWEAGVDKEFVEKLLDWKYRGRQLFTTAAGINLFKRRRVPFSFPEKLVDIFAHNESYTIENEKIARYYQLVRYEIEPEKLVFNDTEKPNAVFVYPTKDGSTAYYGLYPSIIFIKTLLKNYDVRFLIIEKENELYDAIVNTPDIKLLIIAGHGTQTNISFGEEENLFYQKAEKDETYYLDFSDTELEKYLKLLDDDAVIFLRSCLTGKGKEKARNMANFVIKRSGGRKVISAITPMRADYIRFVTVVPFDIMLITKRRKRNITYIK